MGLGALLEQQSNLRMMNRPTVEPSVAPPIAPPMMMEQPAPTSPGMEGLLPLLLGGRGGMQSGMQGGGMGGGSVEQMAHRYFMNNGYTPQDWNKVQYIIGNESSWDPHAVNPSSGAAGIAQNISGFGPNYSRNDPQEQIRWLYNYLNSHDYNGPSPGGVGIDAAYQHKQTTGWY